MEIRVIDFDRLTRNYSGYREGVSSIEAEKAGMISRLDPLKKEMESIINAAKSGLVLDPSTQRQKEARFGELQQEAYSIDADFKTRLRAMHDDLNKKTYDELSEIIEDWSKENSIDLVTGKMEVVFVSDKYDATDAIIQIIKEKGLLYEEVDAVNDQITDSVTQAVPGTENSQISDSVTQ